MTRTKRVYRSALRQANAAATRESILAAAQHCFETFGYSATTMKAIAAQAGVSVEAVHLAGCKLELLHDAFARAFTGIDATSDIDTTVPLLDQPVPKALFSHPDPIQALSGISAWVADRNQLISRLWHAFDQAADIDADTRVVYLYFLRNMRAECVRAIESLAHRKALRTDTEHAELADRFWIILLPDQHRRLCLHAGWTQSRYQQWVVDAMLSSMLPPRLLALWKRRKR
jgi:AcrR family transcriptional regulator